MIEEEKGRLPKWEQENHIDPQLAHAPHVHHRESIPSEAIGIDHHAENAQDHLQQPIPGTQAGIDPRVVDLGLLPGESAHRSETTGGQERDHHHA